MNTRLLRNGLVWLVVIGAVIAIAYFIFGGGEDVETIAFGEVMEDIKKGEVESLTVNGKDIEVLYFSADPEVENIKKTEISESTDILTYLRDENIAITGAQKGKANAVNVTVKESGRSGWLNIFLNLLPFLIFGLFLLLILRNAQGSNSQAMSFGKSKARLFGGSKVTVTFLDVAGTDEAKEELVEVVEFLKFPEKFSALGAKIPKGVLLVGPPGTGKTLLSRAVAGEAGVPFFSISGSEFVEMFVGVGASRVRDLFEQAKKNSPCIVFVDEIDAVGRQRGAGLGGSHDEREQTLNQILVEMDGFDTGTNVIILAATNRPDILDPALLRPGRFDRKVILDAPDVKGREAILNVHMKGKPFDEDVVPATIAKSTPGFSGADLANLVNEAAILAARRTKKIISMDEFEEAVDRVIAGPERKSRVMNDHEKKLTAYHEGGHTVLAHFLEHHDPPHKVTIVARGMAGGYTRFLPDEEAHYRTPKMFRDQLSAALGGLVAEEIIYGESSTGPSNDLEQVTQIARSMVTRWGMSERLGPRTFGKNDEMVFLGNTISDSRNYSEKIAEQIDDEVRSIIAEAHTRATELLTKHRNLLDKLVNVLMEEETMEGEYLTRLLDSNPEDPWPPNDLKPKDPGPTSSPEDEGDTSTPTFEPVIKPGLAWEGGNTNTSVNS
ncbi:MAG: ATP-dependent zinc metalloprotease FtsH [Tepidiformaceae bacterium]